MPVAWHDTLIVKPQPVSDEAVHATERALGIRFPSDFLEVARLYQGAAPEPSKITLPDGAVTSVQALLHFEEEPGMYNIVHRRWPLSEVLEEGVVPFAVDVGGDLFCFDFRNDQDHPDVGYWSVDTGLIALANSFSQWMRQLHG